MFDKFDAIYYLIIGLMISTGVYLELGSIFLGVFITLSILMLGVGLCGIEKILEKLNDKKEESSIE